MALTPSLELATDPWGVHVDRVEIKDVRLPKQMQVPMISYLYLSFIFYITILVTPSALWLLKPRQPEMREPRSVNKNLTNIFIQWIPCKYGNLSLLWAAYNYIY